MGVLVQYGAHPYQHPKNVMENHLHKQMNLSEHTVHNVIQWVGYSRYIRQHTQTLETFKCHNDNKKYFLYSSSTTTFGSDSSMNSNSNTGRSNNK